jgi:hypothetical protein
MNREPDARKATMQTEMGKQIGMHFPLIFGIGTTLSDYSVTTGADQ